MSFRWELRYAVRSLARTPGLAASLIVTVAVGIGIYATMTGFTQGLMAAGSEIPGAKDLVLVDASEGGACVARRPPSTRSACSASLARRSPLTGQVVFHQRRVNLQTTCEC